jgi:GxxExxY protein
MDQVIVDLLAEIITISNDIFNSIGPGYNEVIYHRAFEVALRSKQILYQTEVITPIFYKGYNVGHGRVDIMLGNNLIIELKAISNFNNDTAVVQIKNYMKHYSINNGVIINFGQPNKGGSGELNIKYIQLNPEKTYNLVNNSFIEIGVINV